jgi:4-hydroxy-tetrahydrodipicolinate synthase
MALHGEPSTFVISITPFDAKERFDEAGLRGHFRRLAEAGIGVYVAGGGSGEAYTLTRNETKKILDIAREELLGKVPVRAMGKEPRSAKELIEFGKMVHEAGLEAMQLYSLDAGHGAQPSRAVLERYLDDVISNVEVPLVLSTHQSVGYYIPLDLMAEMVDRYDHVIGINVTNPDVQYLTRLVDMVGRRVEIHVGGPMQALTALALGANGYLSSEANVAPKLAVSVIDRYRAGDLDGTFDAFGRLLRLFAAGTAYGGAKAALDVLGLPGGFPRRPRLPATEDAKQALAEVLDELDIRAIEGIRVATGSRRR